MACFEQCVQPCMARKESALQDVHPLILTIKRTKPIFSGEASPLFSTCSTNFLQVAPRRVRKEGMMRGGKSNSVSALYIWNDIHSFNDKGCRRGLYPSTCNLSTQKLTVTTLQPWRLWLQLFQLWQLPPWRSSQDGFRHNKLAVSSISAYQAHSAFQRKFRNRGPF